MDLFAQPKVEVLHPYDLKPKPNQTSLTAIIVAPWKEINLITIGKN